MKFDGYVEIRQLFSDTFNWPFKDVGLQMHHLLTPAALLTEYSHDFNTTLGMNRL